MIAAERSIITMIEKEKVSSLTFPKQDVLLEKTKIQERKLAISKATQLGNSRKFKVKIIFEDSEEVKRVETTIWGATEKNIILKQGTIIPVRRIHEIKFY